MSTFGAETQQNHQSMERKPINRLKVMLAEKNMTNKRLAELMGKDPSVDDLLWTE